MEKNKERLRCETPSKKERVVKNCLIWLMMLVTVFWGSLSVWSISESADFLVEWPVFEKTVFYTVYALISYLIADFIYHVLLSWISRQRFSFVLTFGFVIAVFILAGVVAFALFMEQTFLFWIDDVGSWRFLPCAIGAVTFARLAYLICYD